MEVKDSDEDKELPSAKDGTKTVLIQGEQCEYWLTDSGGESDKEGSSITSMSSGLPYSAGLYLDQGDVG
jgi:hypothetical protein